VDQTLKLI